MYQIAINKQLRKHAGSVSEQGSEVSLDFYAHKLHNEKKSRIDLMTENIVQIWILLGHA
jgi:hypothetical protein